jgi:LuxR family maltose regulon positive regulatory protein
MALLELTHWMTGFRDLLRFGPSPFHDPSDSTPLPPSVAPVPLISDRALRLYLFGPLRAYVAGDVAIGEHFMRHKAKALLALLYVERGKYIPKDELLDRLWPDLDALPLDSGRLKQTVLVLRRALEGKRSRQTGWQYIVERDGSYFFNTEMAYNSDLEDFEQELRAAYADRHRGDTEAALVHFQRAFALRRAELLPEFRYENWAEVHIEAEREQYLQALEDAARLHAARGDTPSAVALLNVATREDPLRESSVLQLMEWLWRKGDQAEAVRVYGRLRDALATKLQLEPEPKITALYHAIRGDRSALTG